MVGGPARQCHPARSPIAIAKLCLQLSHDDENITRTKKQAFPEIRSSSLQLGINQRAEAACSLRACKCPTDASKVNPFEAWSGDVHVHFTYHSQTQRTVHVTPSLWLICASGSLSYTTEGTNELAGILGLLAFGWLFLANFLMNAVVWHRGPRFGPIDLSKNASPASTGKFLNGLILLAAVAAGGGREGEPPEGVPVPLAGLHDLSVRLAEEIVAESECLLDRARRLEHARIGGDPNDRAQDQRRQAEAGLARHHAGKPGPADTMLRHVLAKGVDQDVHVRQHHFRRRIRST